jgi:hypothetical protein
MPRKTAKLSPQEAKAQLMADGMSFQDDFHALGSSAVQALADTAKRAGYRKSKNAPGSTARMFYQYLSRVAPVVHVPGQLTAAERRAYQARARQKTAHATKKSPAQLQREVNEALAVPPVLHGDRWISQKEAAARAAFDPKLYERAVAERRVPPAVATRIAKAARRTRPAHARIRKTKDIWVVQGNYGYGHGWEDVTAAETWKEAKQNLREYRENENAPFRVIRRRERIAV